MNEVISMARYTESATYTDVRETLRDCGQDERFTGKPKGLVIALNDADGMYDVSWANADLRCSEMLALLEYMKAQILKEME